MNKSMGIFWFKIKLYLFWKKYTSFIPISMRHKSNQHFIIIHICILHKDSVAAADMIKKCFITVYEWKLSSWHEEGKRFRKMENRSCRSECAKMCETRQCVYWGGWMLAGSGCEGVYIVREDITVHRSKMVAIAIKWSLFPSLYEIF